MHKNRDNMDIKYSTKLSDTIREITAICYILGFWKTKNGVAYFVQLFYLISFWLFILSVFTEACLTNNKDEAIFLAVTSLIGTVQAFRLYKLIGKQNKIILLTEATHVNSTRDHEIFCNANNKMKNLMTFAKYFFFITITGCFAVAIVPLVKKKLTFNIAFPWDYKTSRSAFWMAYAFVAASFLLSGSCCMLTIIVWYIMMNLVIKYDILGNDIKKLGVARFSEELQPDRLPKRPLFLQQLIEAMKRLGNINEIFEEFASTFSNLFLLQIFTSSICICGSVSTLAFSPHDNPVQDGFYLIVLFYSLFDTFTVTYLGNEIKLSSNRLGYCLFESDWTEQTQSCKKAIVIMAERLKRPQELIVGKIFPIDLETFTIIANRSYSWFYILQNFRN